ncbi:acyl carrier protein [Geothrix sp.]|jgi:acyl carrier protein|uniref:acyl carrier protein n=1 Tax=Geothrix sp. TaxID=1962974 RepID=UPI0025BE19B8|nr:acyl carrier protein [Geothrix sp.]
MTNAENLNKLQVCFTTALGVPAEVVTETLAYNSIREWDSLGHMNLMSELESVFDVMLDTDDILGLSSVGKAKEILTKHGVTF